MKTQMANNSSGDSLHSVFFISEKEAQLKQKESMLELRQQELERRADEISFILKSFNNDGKNSPHNLPLQQQAREDNHQLHIDSICDLPMQIRQDGGA